MAPSRDTKQRLEAVKERDGVGVQLEVFADAAVASPIHVMPWAVSLLAGDGIVEVFTAGTGF